MAHITGDPLLPPSPDFNGVFDLGYAHRLNAELKKRVFHSLGFCSQCKKDLPRLDLKTCAKCRAVQYCTRECQKLAWPVHKASCTPRDLGHSKLLRTFAANPMFLYFLNIAIIKDLGLDEKKPDTGVLSVMVQFHVLPTVREMKNIMNGPDPDLIPDSEIPNGVLQIGTIVSGLPGSILAPDILDGWRRLRETANAKGHTDPIALIRLCLDGGTTSIIPSQITPCCFDAVREHKMFYYPCPDTGVRRSASVNREGCIQYINWYMKSDRLNLFRLHKPLSRFDLEVIRKVEQLFLNNRKPKTEEHFGKYELPVRSLFWRMTRSLDPLYADSVRCLD